MFVWVGDDGQCPSCRGDTNDVRGLDRDLTTVLIGERSPLPEVCCGCGVSSRRTVLVKQWKPIVPDGSVTTDDALYSAIIVALHVIYGWTGGLLLHALWKRSATNRQTVSVPITQCENCSVEAPPQPLRVDYEHFTMRFVVHRIFKSHFEDIL